MNVNEDHIIDYLEGGLSSGEREAFEKLLANDLEFAQAVETQKLVNQSLAFHHDQDLKEKFATWHAEDQRVKKKDDSKTINIFPKWIAIAATILIAVAATFLLSGPSAPDALFATYYSEPQAGITRDIQASANTEEFTQGIEFYAEGNFEQALVKFERIEKESLNYENSRLLAIDCQVKLKDWSKALALADPKLYDDEVTDIFLERLEWTRVLLLIRSEQDDLAAELLNKLASDSSHLFYNKAKALKEEIGM